MGRKKKAMSQRQLEVLSARVDLDLYKRVEIIAHKTDLNLTQVVRQALREFVERQSRKEAA